MLEDRLIEVVVEPAPQGAGMVIEGLSEDRVRTTANRLRAALLNSRLVTEVPAISLRLEPTVQAGTTSDLDLALALATLVHIGRAGHGLRWILATSRLGLDGAVRAGGPQGQPRLVSVVESLCHTPVVQSERMFDRESGHE
jgi:predicted ATPase with chaperone activity